jgi:chemotaxis protein MotB
MARRRRFESENHERWLISYSDFITLLFAFFTVMYATSQADVEKAAKFEKSFKKAMGMFQTSGNNTGVMSDPIPSHIKDGSPIEIPIKLFNDPHASRKELKDALWQLIDTKMTEQQVKDSGLEIRDDEEGVRITLTSSKLFPEGSAKIIPEALKRLDAVGEILKLANRRLIVEGHTDNEIIASDNYPSNWELAAARASTIVRYLIKRHQVSSDLLSVASYADQRPLAPNDSEENRSKNRRIEILITTL